MKVYNETTGATDDCRSFSVAVEKEQPPPPPPGKPRFSIASIDRPTKVADGESYTVKMTVKNVGDATGGE